jgi:hypothetical protein
MSCKSAIYTVNTNAGTVPINGTIPVGGIVRRFGRDLDISGNGITTCSEGYYNVSVNISLAPSVVGGVSVTLFKDGAPVPGATAVATNTAIGNTVNLNIRALIRNKCCDNNSEITVVLGGAPSAITNMGIVVEKI